MMTDIRRPDGKNGVRNMVEYGQWNRVAGRCVITPGRDTELGGSMPVQYSCVQCGAVYQAYPSDRRLFCSPQCSQASHRVPVEDRFWAKVQPADDGCWLWTGAPNGHGYGAVNVHGLARMAHRVAWELTNGPIPDGLFVLHRCDAPLCCRPDHLFLGTHADNMADMVGKGRQASGERNGARTHPERVPRGERHSSQTHLERLARGERHGQTKLTPADVLTIRADHAASRMSKRALGRRYGVADTTIRQIVRRVTWKEV